MTQLVIFDMDGLMVDSERVCRQLWPLAFPELSQEEAMVDFSHALGRNRNDTIAWLSARYPHMDAAARYDHMEHLVETHLRTQGVDLKPGLLELLDYLEQREIPRVVATSTREENATRLLKQVGVWHRFNGAVFGNMVENSKPDPDIFLLAAGLLQISPEQCMVLEDSVAGVTAAHRANMLPVMIPDLVQPGEEVQKLLHRQLDSLHDVIALLETQRQDCSRNASAR